MDDSLFFGLMGLAGCAAGCWVLSLVTGEHGWIDRIWSFAPVGFAAWFCIAGGATPRLLLMTGLIALWGIRLTYNFARKGGYKLGGEDYRWIVIREKMSSFQFALFNIFWIAIVQNAILFGLALPVWTASLHHCPLSWIDGVAAGLFLLCLAGETIADEQQWKFQKAKRARKERGEDGPSFLTTGLFRFSRHPSFLCEMLMWWAIYLFTIAAGADWLNISILGTLVLTAQFQGSTSMTEKLSLEKYPEYADYQKTTSRLIPGPPGKS